MHHAQIGSIIHGTLLTADLLETFSSELDWHIRKARKELGDDNTELARLSKLVAEAQDILCADDRYEGPQGVPPTESGDAQDIVQELSDALNEFASPYCYFGAAEGDGSDFGFWPSMSSIEELPRIDDCDADKARELGEDCIYVNDHGNVTVFGADGSVLLELV
jgi:hypothetical protein